MNQPIYWYYLGHTQLSILRKKQISGEIQVRCLQDLADIGEKALGALKGVGYATLVSVRITLLMNRVISADDPRWTIEIPDYYLDRAPQT